MTAALNRGELFASFDIDAFEVPHGRDELWRFTPLRRLRGLHDGSAPATGRAEIDVGEQPGVQRAHAEQVIPAVIACAEHDPAVVPVQ